MTSATTTSTTSATTAPPTPTLPSFEPAFDTEFEVFESAGEPIPTGTIEASVDDLLIAGVDGDLRLHPGILDGGTGDPVRLVDVGDPRDPVLEGEGPNQVGHVAGVRDGTLIYSECCEPISGTVLALTSRTARPIPLGAGYEPNLSPDGSLVVTANSYALTITDTATGESRGRGLEPATDVFLNVGGADWAGADTVVMVVYGQDTGFQLVPFDPVTLDQSGPSQPLGVGFDPSADGGASLAGSTADGAVAVNVRSPDSNVISFFTPDPDTGALEERADRRIELPTGARWVQVAADGMSVVWLVGDELWFGSPAGEPNTLGSGYLAAWFPTDQSPANQS